MDIKAKINEIVEKVKSDKGFAAKFKKARLKLLNLYLALICRMTRLIRYRRCKSETFARQS